MCIGTRADKCLDIKVYVEVIWSRLQGWAICCCPLGLFSTFLLFRWFPLPGGLESYFLRKQLPHLLVHFATLPVGKTKMGFIDNTAKSLVLWTLLVGEISRLQVVVTKEELHFPSNTTWSLLFIFLLGEKRRNLTLTCFWKKKSVCFLRGHECR